jgi:hypothetical protein
MNILPLIACATCMGAPGHQTNIAAGNAIVVMLWILLGMALMFGTFAFNLARRAARHAREHGIPGESGPANSQP